MRGRLSRIVNESDTRAGRIFDWLVIVLILISTIELSLETIPDLPHHFRQLLYRVELVITAIFCVEYTLRVFCSMPSRRYVFSFFGIIDLLSILPSLLALGFDLRALRVLRLVRVVRLLKLARYSAAAQRFQVAFSLVREEIVLFGTTALLLLYLSAYGIYSFEYEVQPEKFSSVFESLWWALATLTTVGYGDVYPITVGGKIFTFFVLMIGLGIVAVPSGLIATAFSQAREALKTAERND